MYTNKDSNLISYLQGLCEHERLQPARLRSSEGNVSNLVKLKQIIHTGLTLTS